MPRWILHLCDNISLHRRGALHHSIKTPVFGKFEIRLCSPKASVPPHPPTHTLPPPPTLSSWVGQRLSKKLSNLCLGRDPPSAHLHTHMKKHTHTCAYTGTCTLTHTHSNRHTHHPPPSTPDPDSGVPWRLATSVWSGW